MGRNSSAIRRRLSQAAFGAALAAPLLFLLAFFVNPLASIFGVSFIRADGGLDLSGFLNIASSSYYRNILAFTAVQAVISTAVTMAIAVPCALVFARYQFRGKSTLLSLATLPFVLPPVVVAAAFIALLGERGLVNDMLLAIGASDDALLRIERTFGLILLAHVFYNVPVALRILVAFLANQSGTPEEAGRMLGANRRQVFRFISVPLLRPALLSAALIVFIFCFSSFGIVLILGGPQFATLEVEIYRQAAGIFNLPLAGALAVVQLGAMLLAMSAYLASTRRTAALYSGKRAARPIRTVRDRIAVACAVVLLGILLFTPLAAILIRAISPDGTVTLRYFALLAQVPRASVLAVPAVQTIGTSLVIACVAAILSVGLGTALSLLIRQTSGRLGRLVDTVTMLPLATSAVTLGFGFIIALSRPPLDLRSSFWMIPIAHTLIGLPFVVRSVLPSLQSIPRSINEAALLLGARPAQRVLYVDIPLVRRALLVGAAFAFTTSLGEFGAGLFLARPNTPTISTAIYRFLGQPGINNYGQAYALSAMLLLVCLLCFLLIERFRPADASEL